MYQCKDSYTGCNFNDLKKAQYSTLTGDEQNKLEGKITIYEAGVALKKKMKKKTIKHLDQTDLQQNFSFFFFFERSSTLCCGIFKLWL